jgi:hypothetical protein
MVQNPELQGLAVGTTIRSLEDVLFLGLNIHVEQGQARPFKIRRHRTQPNAHTVREKN